MDYRVAETLNLIESNLPRPTNIQKLAEFANLSVSHFQHLFKSEVGISIKQYIKILRLQKAQILLETTNLRIKEICFEIGFYDNAQFVRDFKNLFGLYPTAYRSSFRSAAQNHKK